MKTVHMFHRRVNFNSTQVQRNTCRATLMHSLRVPTAATKELEWQQELEGENLIWLNGEIRPLVDYNQDKRMELVDAIAPKPAVLNKRKHQNTRRKYKLKLTKAIKAEEGKGHIKAAHFMRQILDVDDKTFISYDIIEQFKNLEMVRKNQRIKMLEIYLKSHNALHQSVDKENAVFVQEGLFKIPHQWGVGTDVIAKKEYITILRDFLQHYFPDYKIEAIVCHHDERAIGEDTGCHPHYFLSGKNEKTGAYDLHKQQISVINQYISNLGKNDDLDESDDSFPADCILTHKQARIFGEYFQKLFFDFINNNLLAKKDLFAEFADETVRKSDERKEMNRQSKLSKAQRSHNLATRQAEMAQKRLNELIESEQREQENLSDITLSVQDCQDLLDKKVANLKRASESLDDIANTIKEKNDEVEQLEQKLSSLADHVEQLGVDAASILSGVCRDIYLRSATFQLGLDEKAAKYVKDILMHYQHSLSDTGKAICSAAAKALDDEELVVGFSELDHS